MKTKIVQIQLVLIATLVSVFLYRDTHSVFLFFFLTLSFIGTLFRHRYLATTIILGLLVSVPQDNISTSAPNDFEFVGHVLEGPTFQPEGCLYRVGDEKEIWTIRSEVCNALPGDSVEAFIRPSKNGAFYGRAVDFYHASVENFSLKRELSNSRKDWIARAKKLEDPGFTIALTTGNKAFLDPKTEDLFKDLGLSHLLAISGLHFGIIAAIFWFLFGQIVNLFPTLILRFGKRRLVGPFVIVGLYAFLLFVGAPISAQRAFLMVGAYILSSIFSRHVSPKLALLYAASALLVYDPSNITNLGFQLSFCALIGILSVLNNRKLLYYLSDENVWRHRFFSLVFVSLAAGLATLPVLLHHSGQISWIAFPLNLVIVPIFSSFIFPAFLSGSALYRLSDFSSPLGEYLLNLLTKSIRWSIDYFDFLHFLPGARSIPGQIPGWATLTLFIIIITALYKLESLRFRFLLTMLGISITLVFATMPRSSAALHVHFIDVGQGDAIFVQTPTGEKVLIDTGGTMFGADPGQKIVAPYLKGLGIDHLDAIVITHDDQDHNGGLDAVLRTISSERLIRNKNESQYLERIGFAVFQVDGQSHSKNDRSLVLKYEYGKSCVLLTGDIEKRAEVELSRKLSSCDVLKVAHHGSKTSSTNLFLDKISPAFAVISAGRNNHFGHPHRSVSDRLEARQLKTLSTQKLGSIWMELDSTGTIKTRWQGH